MRKIILIAEDEFLNFVYLQKLLKNHNYKILHAQNGKEAVNLCVNQVNVVLLDIKMPIMDGYEAAKILRKKFPKLPIIALTAYAMEENRQKALDAGCNEYLSKPIGKDLLMKTLTKYIGEPA